MEDPGFTFVHISDHHLANTEGQLVRGFSPAYAFRAVMRHIAQNQSGRIDFIVSTGDLVDPPSEEGYRSLSRMLNLDDSPARAPGPRLITLEGLQQVPIYFLPGNHDDRKNFFTVLFPGAAPTPLMNRTFTHAGVQFICLDWGMQAKAVAYPETLSFLGAALESGQPSIILTHHHTLPVGIRWLDEYIALGNDSFWNELNGKNVLGVISGHVHLTYELEKDGVPVLGVRSTAFPFAPLDHPLLVLEPPQYRLVTVQDTKLHSQVFEVPL